MRWTADPPGAVHPGFGVCLHTALPYAVGHGVPDGRHHHAELHRPVVQVQRPYAGQMCAQVPVHPGALDTDQSAEVQTGPVRIWESETITSQFSLPKLHLMQFKLWYTISVDWWVIFD